MLAESLVGILKFIARPNFCVPPPARQAATTLAASGQQRGGQKQRKNEHYIQLTYNIV